MQCFALREVGTLREKWGRIGFRFRKQTNSKRTLTWRAPPLTSAVLPVKTVSMISTFDVPVTKMPPPNRARLSRTEQRVRIKVAECTTSAPAACPRRCVSDMVTSPPKMETALTSADMLGTMLQSKKESSPPRTKTWPRSRNLEMWMRGAPSSSVISNGCAKSRGRIETPSSPIIQTCEEAGQRCKASILSAERAILSSVE